MMRCRPDRRGLPGDSGLGLSNNTVQSWTTCRCLSTQRRFWEYQSPCPMTTGRSSASNCVRTASAISSSHRSTGWSFRSPRRSSGAEFLCRVIPPDPRRRWRERAQCRRVGRAAHEQRHGFCEAGGRIRLGRQQPADMNQRLSADPELTQPFRRHQQRRSRETAHRQAVLNLPAAGEPHLPGCTFTRMSAPFFSRRPVTCDR
jgi:hypothetical protein